MSVVIRLDSRRLLVLGLVFALTIVSVYTYISALFAFIAPSQRFPLKVMDVKTFDKGGDPSSIFTRGQTVRIDAEVEMATGYYYYYPVHYYYYDFVGDVPYGIIFTVVDDWDKPVFFDSVTSTISPGVSKTTSFSYFIPFTASKGVYRIQVMVWSEWLPEGGALAQEAGEETFEVT
jgi:hypothetical protein